MSINTSPVSAGTGSGRATGNNLLEESILPVSISQRPIGALGFVWIWIGIAVIIATFQLGANGVSGMPLTHVVAIILVANLVLALLMTLTADIGTEHGLSFAVYLRAPFGIYGTYLPSVFRGIIAAIWFGIQTYLGALALNGIVEYTWGYSNWPLWYLIFALVQIGNTALGIKAVEILATIAAPAIIGISVWMYFTLDVLAGTQGHNIWTFVGKEDIGPITLFLANVAFWSTLAIDIPNITRFVKTKSGAKSFFQRNKNIFAAQLIALPLTQTWIAVIGAASFIAAGDWNPVNVIQGQSEGFSLILLLTLVLLAQWSTNNAANLIPAALTFVNAGAPWISYPVAVLLAGIIGTLAMPWAILDNLFTFLFSYGSFLSAIGGIMVADYYLIRRRRLNVPDLYSSHGQYRYSGGFNCAGIFAWIIAGSLAFVSGSWAFVIGFFAGLSLYYGFMKIWILKGHPQAEVQTPDDNLYLATSVGINWVHDKAASGFIRVPTDHLKRDSGREDL